MLILRQMLRSAASYPVGHYGVLLILASHVWQVESGIAMQNLKPTIDNIKRLYGDDKKKVQRETSELYKKAQISPLAGQLSPTVF